MPALRQVGRALAGGFALAAVLACVAGGARDVRADIYECRGSDGAVAYTNIRAAGARCRTIVRESARSARAATPAPGSSARPEPPSDRYRRFDPHLEEAARLYQLPLAFLRAVVRVESDFNPYVVSHDGAMGLMQLMPRTARAMGVLDPFDPRQNILGGARYLRVLANKFSGDLVLTVAAYNAGEGAVVRHRGIPPYDETRRYVQRVLQYYYQFRAG